MISPFTCLTASLRASILTAISFANCVLPSSRNLSISSLRLASSNSSLERVVGPDSKNERITGDEAIVDDDNSECKYERRVRRFFSRAKRDVGGVEDVGFDEGRLLESKF